MRPLSQSSQTLWASGISEITKCRPMAHLLWFENGKAGLLDPIPLNSFSFLYFSKSCWYNLDHLQHLHLQGVLWSTEFYEYFRADSLLVSDLDAEERREFLGNALPMGPQGPHWPPTGSTFLPAGKESGSSEVRFDPHCPGTALGAKPTWVWLHQASSYGRRHHHDTLMTLL